MADGEDEVPAIAENIDLRWPARSKRPVPLQKQPSQTCQLLRKQRIRREATSGTYERVKERQVSHRRGRESRLMRCKNSLRLKDTAILDTEVFDEPVRHWATGEGADEGANERRDAAHKTDRRCREVVGRGSEDLCCWRCRGGVVSTAS